MPITRHGYRPKGPPAERGYGHQHRALRQRLAPLVATGQTTCARCGQRIRPGEHWDLDHTEDRNGYLGPSHATCNRSQGATGGGVPSKNMIPRKPPQYLFARNSR